MGRRLPKGYRRGHDDSIACPHRDVSCCEACALRHVEIVEAAGNHYWIADKAEREALKAEVQAILGRKR